jgi:hypothetical protein
VPSPDVRGYLDLTLDDRGPIDLLRTAVLNYASWLPDVTLQEGHTESVLLESFAILVSEQILRINRLPSGMSELLLRLFGLERSIGAVPRATLRFTSNGVWRVESPAGVRARLELPGGLEPVVFATSEALVIPANPGGPTYADVPATGDRYTSEANGIAAGTTLVALDAIAGVDAITLATPTSQGADPEDGAAFLDRGMALLRMLSSVLVRPDQFTARVVLDPRYPRAYTVDNYDPGQAGAPGDHPGHVTVAVLGLDGALVPPGEREALASSLEEDAQANLDVHVIDPTITDVDVAATVRARPGYSDEQVEANVTSAIASLLDPLVWPFESTVYRLAVVGAADDAEGIARVEQVLLDGNESDVTLPGVAPLARLGATTITITR